MKLGPVTKIDKRNTARSKKFDEFLQSCDVIVIFPIYGQFVAIRKPDPGRIKKKLTFSIIVVFYVTKTENITKKTCYTAVILLLCIKVLFLPQNANFL